MLAVFLVLSCVVAAASPEPVPQALLLMIVCIALGRGAWRLLVQRTVNVVIAKLQLVAFGTVSVYMYAVYQSIPMGISVLNEEYLSIAAKLLLGPLAFGVSFSQRWGLREIQHGVAITMLLINVILIIAQLADGINTGLVLGRLHSNYMGLSGAIGLIYACMFHKSGLIRVSLVQALLIVSILTIVVSVSRGALVSVMAGAMFYVGMTRLMRLRIIRSIILAGIVITLLLISAKFDSWVKSEYAKEVSNYSESLTGKAFDTGRSKYWGVALHQISENPIYGIGIEARSSWDRELSNGNVITLSVHNYYLAVLLESGLVGLLSVLTLIFYIHNRFFGQKGDVSILGSAVILGSLIYQTAEVSLTTGTYTAGAMIWILWGALARLVISLPVASGKSDIVPIYKRQGNALITG